ncbi:hypothetical protein MsAm2_10360 [Methanolapillus ohkumae]|uniref:Uncharacterized protein n=1 Tax=Methanolapillus ohkumae TaxID=3028298 RepID=A0AA96ZVZ1_9EURY|nr:hypothetical protein MsAm2_10360 [Methanosarcinaceae archaeon Am2]
MNGKVKYHGTEKIEKKIYDDIEEKLDSHLRELSEQTKESILYEIREELQPETVPYDRLRLIEQRIHELSTTQDGIVREIVDIKTTLNTLSKELARLRNNAPALEYVQQPSPSTSYSQQQAPSSLPYSPFDSPTYVPHLSPAHVPGYVPASSFSSHTPYPSAQIRPENTGHGVPEKPPEKYVPAPRSESLEYREYVPASQKKNVEPERFVPARATPAKNDPFYFGNPDDMVDVSPLKRTPAESFSPSAETPAKPNYFSVESIKPKSNEPEYPPEKYTYIDSSKKQKLAESGPDKSEYLIGKNTTGTVNDDTDYNKDCEYIIAESSAPKPKSRFPSKKGFSSSTSSDKKERVITNDEEDSEIIM